MGNTKKFKELLLLVVSKFGEDGVVETKLMKLLYFVEAEYFRLQKKTITGVDYFKNNFGPTPNIKVLEEAYSDLSEFLKRENRKSLNDKPFRVFSVFKKDFSYKNLTEEEIEVTQKILKLYGSLPTGELIRLSHFDPPYLVAKPKERINFKFVLHRKNTERDFEESISKDDQEKVAKEISSDNLEKLFDYVGSTSA